MRVVNPVPAAVVLVLIATACTSTPPDDPQPPSAEPSNNAPDPADETGDPQPPAESAEDAILSLWEDFHRVWTEQTPIEQPDPAAFENLAVDPTAAAADLVDQRLEARTVTTEFELWPSVTISGDTAAINDCVIATQHPKGSDDTATTVSIRWEAQAVETDDGWRIETARQLELFCVAEELNDQLLAAYRDYRAAKDAAWDPPDPDHPALEQTMTGDHLDFIRDLLIDHEREGIVIRDPAPTNNAVVWDLGIGTATVSDCARQVADRGAFDLETGERLDELIPPVRDGQLDAQSVDLIRTGGGEWKVANQDGTRDTNCIEGSSRYAVH